MIGFPADKKVNALDGTEYFSNPFPKLTIHTSEHERISLNDSAGWYGIKVILFIPIPGQNQMIWEQQLFMRFEP